MTTAGAVWARCEGCRAMVFAPNGGPLVVIAHDSERLTTRIGVALGECGLQPLHAVDGPTALRLIEAKRPAAAVLDVGLGGGVMSFQIIERVRAAVDLALTKVVLVASVFNKMAYKRRPTSLYGADDYVEQHHIHDLLPRKLCTLLDLPMPLAIHDEQRLATPDPLDGLAMGDRVRALAEGRQLLSELAGPARLDGDPLAEAFGAVLEGIQGGQA